MSQSILVLAAYGAPYEGNFIPSIRMLSQKLKQQNIDTVLILQNRVKEYDWTKKLDWCSELLFISDSVIPDAKSIAGLMRRYSFCLVHTHFAESKHILAVKAAMLLTGTKIPVVDHHHARVHPLQNPVKQWIKNLLWSGDIMVACGEKVAEDFAACKMRNESRLIENAIDFTRFPDVRISERPLNILMFGYNYRIKGVDIALDACENAIKKHPQLKLQICVATGMENIRKEIANRFGSIPRWVELLPPSKNVADYYKDALIYLCASREEGFCYAVVEAAYCGCMVLSSEIDGPKQIQIPGIRFFESEKPQALAQALDAMLQMSEIEQRRLTESLHNSAENRYGICRWVDGVLQLYKDYHLI